VTLTASNATGSGSVTKTNYIMVTATGQGSTMTLQVNTYGSGYQGEVDGLAGSYLIYNGYNSTAIATLSDATSIQSIPLMQFADNNGTGIGTIPSGATVTNAILTLTVTTTYSPSGTDILYAAPIATAWTCCTNTTLPTINAGSAVSAVIPNLTYPATGTINLNVTSIVQSWVNGSLANRGLALYSDAQYRGAGFDIANFGYNGINAPILSIYYVTSGGGPTNPFVTWQNSYFTAGQLANPAFSGPNADPLGKGISNTNAFLAGFNPVNPSAYPHIISAVKSGNDMNIVYLGSNGDTSYQGGPSIRTNVLKFATGATDGSYTNNFTGTVRTDILSNGTGTGASVSVTDIGGATNVPARYYRVQVLAP
jgi:PKD repeat protein